ncbi:MAG: DUF1254 domain-containing protein [Ilumatobacteraceae bacterium]
MSTAVSGLRSYDIFDADQMRVVADPDALPDDHGERGRFLRMLAMDATIYGLPSVFQYAQLHEQAVDSDTESYTGFNQFLHQRELAGPDFDAFKTPNVDTLYSNAWLDLSGGPLVVEVPPIPDRYYTLQVVDMYGNSTNLSSRTVGPGGGRFLVATTTWSGDIPADAAVFRVATPYMWILMRILVKAPGVDETVVRALQDLVTITPLAERIDVAFPAVTFEEVQTRAMAFFQALDWTIRNNGHPLQEEGYVQRFRSLGIGTPDPLDPADLDPVTRASMEAGFADAMAVISSSRGQVGTRGPTGWDTGTVGELGFAYLRRAIQNFVGTGGNVAAEKKFFVRFHDGDGHVLDGAAHRYQLTFETPPPVDGHWSLTMYPQATGLLYPNEIDRYAVAATTGGVVGADGRITILIQHEPPDGVGTWLPAPEEPFYIDLRLWEPHPEAQDGRWLPPQIERTD